MAAENPVVFAEIGNPKRVTQLTENTSTTNAYFLTEKAGEPEAKKTAYSTVESAVNAKIQSEYLKTLSPTPSDTKTMSEKLEVAEFKKRDDKIVVLDNGVATLSNVKADKSALKVTDDKVNTIQTNVDNQLHQQDIDFQQKAAAEFEKNKNYVDNKSIEIAPLSVTPETLSEATKQYIEGSGGGTITNLADDEDLVSQSNVLKFKDKAYQPQNFSGLGRKMLRKNIDGVSGKNILTQDMINQPNTIYEIQYDYDLNGATINIPEGCVLAFSGGRLRKGKLIASNVTLQATPVQIFEDIELYGDFGVLQLEYFGAKPDGVTDCFSVLVSILRSNKDAHGIPKNNRIKLNKGVYAISQPIFIEQMYFCSIIGEGVEISTIKYTGEKTDSALIHLKHTAYCEFGDFGIDSMGNARTGLILEDDQESAPRSSYNVFRGMYFRNFHDTNGFAVEIGNVNKGTYMVSENIFHFVRTARCVNGLRIVGQQTINNTFYKWQEDNSHQIDGFVGTTITHEDGLLNTIVTLLSENKCCLHIVEPTVGTQAVRIGTVYAENTEVFMRSTKTHNGSGGKTVTIDVCRVLTSPSSFENIFDFTYNIDVSVNTLILASNVKVDKKIGVRSDLGYEIAGYPKFRVGLIQNNLAAGSTLNVMRNKMLVDANDEYSYPESNITRKFYKTLTRSQPFTVKPAFFGYKTGEKYDFGIGQIPGRRYEGCIEVYDTGQKDHVVARFTTKVFAVNNLSIGSYVPVNADVSDATGNISLYIENGIMKALYKDTVNNEFKRRSLMSIDNYGPSLNRPTLAYADVGVQFYDTTLKKYICWNGTAWTNLDGTALV